MILRWDRIWSIVRKEFSEFRRNKYILYSLVLMPILLSTVMPVIYLLPVANLSEGPSEGPIDLGLDLTSNYTGQVLSGMVIGNASLVDCTISNAVITGCRLDNCTVANSLVSGSELIGGQVTDSQLGGCNLDGTDLLNSNLQGSVVIGQPSETQSAILLLLNILLIFFILIPTVIPTVVASYTIVGEKINRSLEPLLATPTTDLELLIGKSASIFIPCVLITWAVFLPFVAIVDIITGPVLGYYAMPNAVWLIGVFLLAPMICALSILSNVIISSRVSDVRSAQQLGSLVVLPIVAFIIIMALGLISLTPLNVLLLSLAVLVIDIGILNLARRTFRREEILVNWK
jgi:ABC-2 type transport system permease protein